MGMGGGRGMGQGRGMGRGMRQGGGRGGGMMGAPSMSPFQGAPGSPQYAPQMDREQELELLKSEAQSMEEQIQAVKKRISEIDKVPAGKSGLIAVVDSEKCVSCGVCQETCPTGAISVEETARIDPKKCTGCGECIAGCPTTALSLRESPFQVLDG